jgi:hypothetical protein
VFVVVRIRGSKQNVINLIAEIVQFQDSSQSNGSGTGKKT